MNFKTTYINSIISSYSKFAVPFVMGCILGISSVVEAQTASASDALIAQPISDRNLLFDVTALGVQKPIIWGLDLAWLSEHNLRRGIAFMGQDNVDIIRSSFMPTDPLVNGALQGTALANTNTRINLITTHMGTGTDIVLNSDHPSVSSYFYGNAVNWSNLIQETAQMHIDAGFNVIAVSPFNEPDYSATGQGTIDHFNNINIELKSRSYFDNIRISGPNSLNPGIGIYWYNYLSQNLDEGNTHQLAGTFDEYADFFQLVSGNGHHASNDELHNIMEAMVGVEYGLDTGIWWGPAEYARGELVKASDGDRLAYAEHRPNWTAAAVYRAPDGKVQAFGGVSERQASPTNYAYLSRDRAVYFDGHGPQREYVIELPADPNGAYQSALQRNAERVVNVTWGDDIQPAIDGVYKLVNKNSNLVMEVNGTSNGANLRQNTFNNSNSQKFEVTPVPSDIGGDYSYYRIKPLSTPNKSLDVVNFSLDWGANIHLWDQANGGNQQWYLEYDADGWFYIRSRESSLCIDVVNASLSPTANCHQWEKHGGDNQKWRLLPVDAPIEYTAPTNPTNLVATAQKVSISLSWDASPETDVVGYNILRAETEFGDYNTIGRNVASTSFVDNTAEPGVSYFYKVKAVDYSQNHSGYTNIVSAVATGQNALVARYDFEDTLEDITENLNHSASYSQASFSSGNIGNRSLYMFGTNFIQLPPDVANYSEITIAQWVKFSGGNVWQRIFDFGNSQEENLFLTAKNGDGNLQFTITSGGTSVTLVGSALSLNTWTHVAVTIGANGIKLYTNGTLTDQSANTSLTPMLIKPIQNYIGRSQWPDPLLNGFVDDFRIYNYELTEEQIDSVIAGLSVEDHLLNEEISMWPIPADHIVTISSSSKNLESYFIVDLNGRIVQEGKFSGNNNYQISTSSLNEGLYLVQIKTSEGLQFHKKLVISH